ncbi:hypothetical protein E4U37_000609 [Claviceps purpurea]|nr:hypothetical protein E4U37_000609 [Claviceps purpurea]
MEPSVPTIPKDSRIMKPIKESLPDHLKKFCADISTEWRQCSEDVDQNSASTTDLNNRIVWAYDYYVEEEKYGFELEQMFAEDFMEWSFGTWKRTTPRVRQEMRDLIATRGTSLGRETEMSATHSLRRLIADYVAFSEIDMRRYEDDHKGREVHGEDNKHSGKADPERADILQLEQRAERRAQRLFQDFRAKLSMLHTIKSDLLDAIDEGASNASICSADIADGISTNFDEKDAADESDYLDGQERAKDTPDNDTTSLVSTETHKKEKNPPEGFAHAKERSAGVVLVELNKEENKFLPGGLALEGFAREKATAQWKMPWYTFLRDSDSYYRLVARLVP